MQLVQTSIASVKYFEGSLGELGQIQSFFAECEFPPPEEQEEQAVFPLYIPFLVCYRLSRTQWSHFSYETICRVLESHIFERQDYDNFLRRLNLGNMAWVMAL